jgi:hypothetical protein
MRVILIGDSQGVGLTEPLRARLRAAGHELVWSKAEVGAPTARAIPWAAGAPPADLAIVVLGGNDGNLATDNPTRYVTLINQLVEALQARGIPRIVWVGPANATSPRVQDLHSAARAVQAGAITLMQGVQWIDGTPMTADLPTSDSMGAHFAARERAIWADRIMAQITPASDNRTTILGALAVGLTLAAVGFTVWLDRASR